MQDGPAIDGASEYSGATVARGPLHQVVLGGIDRQCQCRQAIGRQVDVEDLHGGQWQRQTHPTHRNRRFRCHCCHTRGARAFRSGPKVEDMIRLLVEGHETAARTSRDVFKIAEVANDQPTCNLLTQRMQVHEKTA
jgi:hypothetical protein